MKSPLLPMPEMLRAASPVFLSLMCCAAPVDPNSWPGKFRLAGETDTFGAGAEPIPLRDSTLAHPLQEVADPAVIPALEMRNKLDGITIITIHACLRSASFP